MNDTCRMIETKYGKVSRINNRITANYQQIWVDFDNKKTVIEILEHNAITIGEEVVRVTTPEVSYSNLKQKYLNMPTAKVVGIPREVPPKSLFEIIKPTGATTCFVPLTSQGIR